MMPLGIFTGYFPYGLAETIQRIKAHGFTTVQLDTTFKDIVIRPGPSVIDDCKRIADAFREANLPISCIAAYKNLAHPNSEVRRSYIDHVKFVLKHARLLGTPYVASEAGTYNADSDYIPDPKNATEAGYQECRDVLAQLAQFAYDHGAVFILETYVNNVVGTIERTNRIVEDIESRGFGLMMDPTNYFEDHNIDRMDETLNAIFDAPLAAHIKCAHAKDVKRSTNSTEKYVEMDASSAHSFRGIGAIEMPGPGLGTLNYELYLRRLSERYPNIPLIIEHLEEPDVARAKRFVDEKLKTVAC
jgi:sugar phosphate isomerase/epimerase